jgi:hypothetical protein
VKAREYRAPKWVDATPQDGTLNYAVVWQKVNGQWMLNTDTWNMDK